MNRLTAFVFSLLAVALLTVPSTAQQQGLDPNQTLPVDPQVTVGTLDNGLTYYIRTNQRPENRAEFRLVVKAGSVLEDEDQLGLAHFLEHMAFNGTEHFEKQEVYRENVPYNFTDVLYNTSPRTGEARVALSSPQSPYSGEENPPSYQQKDNSSSGRE